jgi:hypothetical protein
MRPFDTFYLEKQAIVGLHTRNNLRRMDFDDFLFGLILCGVGVAVACFRSEYVHLRALKASERKRQQMMRELQLKKFSAQAGDHEQAA